MSTTKKRVTVAVLDEKLSVLEENIISTEDLERIKADLARILSLESSVLTKEESEIIFGSLDERLNEIESLIGELSNEEHILPTLESIQAVVPDNPSPLPEPLQTEMLEKLMGRMSMFDNNLNILDERITENVVAGLNVDILSEKMDEVLEEMKALQDKNFYLEGKIEELESTKANKRKKRAKFELS
jgi:hypothetical protein